MKIVVILGLQYLLSSKLTPKLDMNKALMTILSILLSLNAFAYQKSDIKLTEHEYRRFMRPQLKNIVQDYYSLAFELSPALANKKQYIRLINELYTIKENTKKKCNFNLSESCLTQFEVTLTNLFKLSQFTLSADELAKSKNLSIDEVLLAQDEVTRMHQEVYTLITYIEELKLKRIVTKFDKFSSKKIISRIDKVILNFQILILKLSDNRLTDELSNFWSNFVNPVQKHILIGDNVEYFKDNINDLNLRWNNLNVRVTKRNIKLSRKVKLLVGTMHNRWNSILKLALR